MDDQDGDNVKVATTDVEKKADEVNPVDDICERKRNKEEKTKKKDDKRSAEQFLRSLTDVHSVEDKLEILCKKYSEAVDGNRKLQLTLKQYDKKILTLQREKEQYQTERSKAALIRTKLESLCRELQKQNRAVKDQSLMRMREQEKMRKELVEKFQAGVTHIATMVNKNTEKSANFYKTNMEMTEKFNAMYGQVELKEQELRKVHQEMQLEMKETDARLEKVIMKSIKDTGALLDEKHQLLRKLTEYEAQIQELKTTEIDLRSQISMYTDKYEFQNALTRSNKVYREFNEALEKMSKKILMLEKETSVWKQRWENSHTALLEMAADKQIRDSEIATLSKKLSVLEHLCKVLQCDKMNLYEQLKAKNEASQSETPSKTENNTREHPKCAERADEWSKHCTERRNSVGKQQDSKRSETIQRGIRNKSSKDSTVDSKERTDPPQKEAEESSSNSRSNETERLGCTDSDKDRETNENRDLSKSAESCETERSSDAEESAKIEETTRESVDKEIRARDESEEDVESTREKCSPCPVSDAENKGRNTQIEECSVETKDTNDLPSINNDVLPPQTESVELNGRSTCSSVQEETNGDVTSNVKNLCDQVELLQSETEHMIEQLYKMIDSVRLESAENSDIDLNEVTCINVRIAENEIPLSKDTVPTKTNKEITEKNNDIIVEPVTTLISKREALSEEQFSEIDSLLIKTNNEEKKIVNL